MPAKRKKILKDFFSFCSLLYLTRAGFLSEDRGVLQNTAIAMSMTGEYMPGASPLTRKYHFGDSILLTSVSLPVDLLPRKVKNQCFKILPSKAICSMLVRDSSSAELPNYLSVRRFEKSDTGFYVQMQSLSCLPFGGGGSLGIYLKKVRDSFVVVSQSSSSIN